MSRTLIGATVAFRGGTPHIGSLMHRLRMAPMLRMAAEQHALVSCVSLGGIGMLATTKSVGGPIG